MKYMTPVQLKELSGELTGGRLENGKYPTLSLFLSSHDRQF